MDEEGPVGTVDRIFPSFGIQSPTAGLAVGDDQRSDPPRATHRRGVPQPQPAWGRDEGFGGHGGTGCGRGRVSGDCVTTAVGLLYYSTCI